MEQKQQKWNQPFLISAIIWITLICAISAHRPLSAAAKEPAWMSKLTPGQRTLFQQCPSVYENRKKVIDKDTTVFDYYSLGAQGQKYKQKVEGAHFTVGVRQGKYGNAGSLAGDLHYVLNFFPNHPQALLLMGKQQLSDDFQPRRSRLRKDKFFYSLDCYVQRALEINENIASTHLIAGILKHRAQHFVSAEQHYLNALELAPDDVEVHYNLGLLYFDRADYESSVKHAQFAYANGYELPGLAIKLQEKGKWQ